MEKLIVKPYNWNSLYGMLEAKVAFTNSLGTNTLELIETRKFKLKIVDIHLLPHVYESAMVDLLLLIKLLLIRHNVYVQFENLEDLRQQGIIVVLI